MIFLTPFRVFWVLLCLISILAAVTYLLIFDNLEFASMELIFIKIPQQNKERYSDGGTILHQEEFYYS
jgi:hypothetical protein